MLQEIERLEKEAECGNVTSMLELADYYSEQKEYKKAFRNTLKASSFNYPDAERKIGYYFEKGIGVNQSYSEAKRYYELAILHGDQKAKYNLALLYLNGKGVDKDIDVALLLAEQSADSGYGKACLLMSNIYENYKQDYESSYEYLKKAEFNGESSAYHLLGRYAYLGLGRKQSFEDAFTYFYNGAEINDTYCFYYLGIMYQKGQHVEQNDSQAFYWQRRGALNGDPRAMYNVAIFFEKGHYVNRDLTKAKYWLGKAKDLGFELAMQKLSQLEN